MKKLLLSFSIFTLLSFVTVSAASIGPKTEYYGTKALTYGTATKYNYGTQHYSQFTFSKTGGGMRMYVYNTALTAGTSGEKIYITPSTTGNTLHVNFNTQQSQARYFYQELFDVAR